MHSSSELDAFSGLTWPDFFLPLTGHTPLAAIFSRAEALGRLGLSV